MFKNTLGLQLREKRKAKRITIVELAEKSGISQAEIARIERSEIEPSPEQVKLMLQYL